MLRAVKAPFQDPRVYHAKGEAGLPAFGFRRGSNVVVPFRMYMPKRFFRDFSILVSVRPDDEMGGYLFAVVNPFDTVVDLGVLLEPAGSQTNISLVYTDSKKDYTPKAIASFLVPRFIGQWTQFAIQAKKDKVTLYFRCQKFGELDIDRKPKELQFDEADKLYIAQAGPILLKAFEVSPFIRYISLHYSELCGEGNMSLYSHTHIYICAIMLIQYKYRTKRGRGFWSFGYIRVAFHFIHFVLRNFNFLG